MPLDIKSRVSMETAIARQHQHVLSLSQKVQRLQGSPSADPVQQLQTDAIVDLYEAVRQIQEFLWPLMLLLPNVSDVRDAANAAQQNANPFSPLTSTMATKPRFRP